jgi:hypothetical protein
MGYESPITRSGGQGRVGAGAEARLRAEELGEQSEELFAQVQMLGFMAQSEARIGGSLQGVAQVGEAQEPEGVVKIAGAGHREGDPAGAGQPAMAFGEMLFEQDVADSAREGNIDISPEVNVADLGFAEAEFAAAEAMRRDPDLRPDCDALFEDFCGRVHLSFRWRDRRNGFRQRQ